MRTYLTLLLAFLLCGPAFFSSLHACAIEDEEEYAVLAAVLFPNEPDVPADREREGYLAIARVRLTGFHSSFYRIKDRTIQETEPSPYNFIDNDFNEKNREACKIDSSRLRPYLPKDGAVSLVEADKREQEGAHSIFGGQAGGRPGRSLFDGMTYLSRPGFNKDRTEAMVEAHHQAHPEMGVGYRVYLRKSPKTGKWVLTAAKRTRIS